MKQFFTKHPIYIFVILFGVLFLLSNQQKALKLPPRSKHQWRQSDAYSMTMNYYQDGMHFWEPKIHLQHSSDGKAVGEFPLIYYVDAMIWKVTGPSFTVSRTVNLLLSFLGLLALFKLTLNLTRSNFWAVVVPMLIAVSPLFSYYSTSFLVNTDALALIFISWYGLHRFFEKEEMRYLVLAVSAATLAGLLRTTMLIGYLPAALLLVLYLQRRSDLHFSRKILFSCLLALPLILTASWMAFATGYNQANHSIYFLTSIKPLWEAHDPGKIWTKFYFEHMNEVLPTFFRGALLTLLLIILVFLKRRAGWMWYFTLFTVFGLIAYTVLWYQNLDAHDYYLIEFLLLIPVIVLSVLVAVKESGNLFSEHRITRSIVSVMVLILMLNCSVFTRIKYDKKVFFLTRVFMEYNQIRNYGIEEWYYERTIQAFETIEPYLHEIGIRKNDLVISLPDGSSNVSLSLMNRKGFSSLYTNEKDLNGAIDSYIEKGAKYLIICDGRYLKENDLSNYTGNKIGQYKNVEIYRL